MRQELNIKQNTPEWLESRLKYATGSNAFILLTDGVKAAIAKNNSNGFAGNFWTARGHVLEEECVELYGAIYDTKLLRIGVVRNTRYRNAQCSPDAEDTKIDALIEIKCLATKNHLIEIENPSAKYIAQANFNALICSRKKALLVFYCPDENIKPEKQFVVVDVTNKKIQSNIKRRLNEPGN